jgi:hypothetical protein
VFRPFSIKIHSLPALEGRILKFLDLRAFRKSLIPAIVRQQDSSACNRLRSSDRDSALGCISMADVYRA